LLVVSGDRRALLLVTYYNTGVAARLASTTPAQQGGVPRRSQNLSYIRGGDIATAFSDPNCRLIGIRHKTPFTPDFRRENGRSAAIQNVFVSAFTLLVCIAVAPWVKFALGEPLREGLYEHQYAPPVTLIDLAVSESCANTKPNLEQLNAYTPVARA
jgi:hypothetical protein